MTLQRQARALGDPTRHEIFRYLADARRSVDVAELTSHFGLHHNAIRQHLGQLVAADLVSQQTSAPSGRGRPRLAYTLEPAAASRWGVAGPYEQVALLLSEVIRTGDSPTEVGRRAAVTLGSGDDRSIDPAVRLTDSIARYGFDPVLDRAGCAVEIVLRVCPFETVALADPDTVCDLHLGISQGLAESIGGLVVDDLIRNDPRERELRIALPSSRLMGADGCTSLDTPGGFNKNTLRGIVRRRDLHDEGA